MAHKLNAEVSKVDVKVSAFWIIILSIRIYQLGVVWLAVVISLILKKKKLDSHCFLQRHNHATTIFYFNWSSLHYHNTTTIMLVTAGVKKSKH